MADEEKKEEKQEKQEKPVVKSWNELKKEARTRARESYAKKLADKEKNASKDDKDTKVVEKVDEPPKEEVKEGEESEKKEEPKEPKIDVSEVARKAAEEAAKKVADDAKKDKVEFQAKLDAILNQDKDIQQKQKDADELITSWDKEQRLPKDYKELIDETMRVADAKMAQKQRELERKSQETKPAEPPSQTPQQKSLEDYQKEIANDLNALYDSKELPRPTSYEEVNNPNTTDSAAKETQKILAFGVRMNTQIAKTGGVPLTSIKQIFALYKLTPQEKRSEQPPGAEAPVSPSRNQSVTEQSKPTSFYQKGEDGHYHAKSWAQIKYEQMKAKLGR